MANASFRTGLFVGGVVLLAVLLGAFFGFYRNRPDDDDDSHHHHHEGGPTVSVASGALRGEWLQGHQRADFKFAAFRGIPYAQPPLGDLRFKSPRPPAKWQGVYNATREGSACFQTGGQAGSGSEDCLYLNVYTPALHAKQPVYVFIHGAAFQYGSADMNRLGPHFLVQKGIVVVTMNYRLNVFGHLSLDTDDVPGNADLKDQLQALRWVRDNIEQFGGDPSQVTLGGQSSGGVSASWLAILPAAKGLFRYAITQSGTAVSSWSYTSRNIEFAKKVYELLTERKSEDPSEMARTFFDAEPLRLLNAAESATKILQENEALGTNILYFHLPCIERRKEGGEERLITKDPESYIIQNETDHIPMIVGETKNEWGAFYLMSEDYKNQTHLENSIEHLIRLVPNSIVPGTDTQKILGIEEHISTLDVTPFVKKIKDFYFDRNTNVDATCNNQSKMAKYLDQAYIMTDTSRMMQLRSEHSTQPTYGYVFNFKSYLNTDTSQFPEYLKTAVVHGDDLAYVWWREGQNYDGNYTASVTLQRMVTMVANFIKKGNPTPEKDQLITEIWKPVNQNQDESYLEITENIAQLHESMQGEKDNKLWSEIFTTIRQPVKGG